MKWYNRDKTRSLDLDDIRYWYYDINYEDYLNPIITGRFFKKRSYNKVGGIRLDFKSSPPNSITLIGEEAKEIWELLKNNAK